MAVCVPGVSDAAWEDVLKRAPKARDIYLAIRTGGEATVPQLTVRFGNVSGQVKLLCERGLIDIEERFLRERMADGEEWWG